MFPLLAELDTLLRPLSLIACRCACHKGDIHRQIIKL